MSAVLAGEQAVCECKMDLRRLLCNGVNSNIREVSRERM